MPQWRLRNATTATQTDNMHTFLDTLAICEAAFVQLEASIPDPIRITKGEDFVFRYDKQTPHIVVVQKLSRIVTGLRAEL